MHAGAQEEGTLQRVPPTIQEGHALQVAKLSWYPAILHVFKRTKRVRWLSARMQLQEEVLKVGNFKHNVPRRTMRAAATRMEIRTNPSGYNRFRGLANAGRSEALHQTDGCWRETVGPLRMSIGLECCLRCSYPRDFCMPLSIIRQGALERSIQGKRRRRQC